MKPGRLFKKFALGDDSKVVLREADSTDLEKLLSFINGLVREKRGDGSSQLFTGFESRLTRKQEAGWLGGLVRRIRKRDAISVLAELDGEIIGNGEITRGPYRETRHHGQLALTIRGAYRGLGLGREMVRALLAEARRQGLRTVHVEFLSTNKAAVRVYERAGFKKWEGFLGKSTETEDFSIL